MLKKLLYFIILLFEFSLCAALNVAVGTAPEKYIIEQIGGEKVNVFCVMPPGKNLHDFSITPSAVRKVAECRAFFHTGLLFEHQLIQMLRSSKVQIWDLTMNTSKIIDRSSHHAHADIHTWFSYNNLYKMAVEAERVLSELDPANAVFYFQNRENLCDRIIADRHNAEKKLDLLPHRIFLTHHAAFGYFAHEFNLQQHSFEFNGREITPKNIAKLSKLARQYKIKKIFIQSTASLNVRSAIMNATGAELVIIDPSDYDILGNLNKFTAELEVSFGK